MRDLVANENDVLRARIVGLEANVERLETANELLRTMLVEQVVLGFPLPRKADAPRSLPSHKLETALIVVSTVGIAALFAIFRLTGLLP